MWADYIEIMAVLGLAYICLRSLFRTLSGVFPPALREGRNYNGQSRARSAASFRSSDCKTCVSKCRKGKFPGAQIVSNARLISKGAGSELPNCLFSKHQGLPKR